VWKVDIAPFAAKSHQFAHIVSKMDWDDVVTLKNTLLVTIS